MSDQGNTPSDPYEPPGEGSSPPGSDQPGYYGGQPSSGQQPGYGGNPQFGQPQYGQAPGGPPPSNYLVWAILSTIFCCLPLGIASIVFAAQVNSKWAAGDFAGAHESSAKAKKFAIWSAAVALVLTLIYVVVAVAVVGAGSN